MSKVKIVSNIYSEGKYYKKGSVHEEKDVKHLGKSSYSTATKKDEAAATAAAKAAKDAKAGKGSSKSGK